MIVTPLLSAAVITGLLIITTLGVFIVSMLVYLSDGIKRQYFSYWKTVIQTTLEYLSVAAILWGVGLAVALFFFTIGVAMWLGGVPV